ncbi:TonB family protein [Stenotrophomonas sp. MYb238]|uniref:TonB family protein n=1 Tax=Stenotrophomonas sp. MYb238 TaxID=2040281 RepID=UPI001884E26C|nr:TonB family protein [Stenotrophomonas sp. MYb238]
MLETALASGVAMAVVLALRGTVRHRLGASAAYLLWLAVPVALVAVLLPAPRSAVLPMTAIGATMPAANAALAPDMATLPWALLLGGAWLAGALLTMAWLLRQQRRFVRGLGMLRRRDDGSWQARAAAGLPAVVGLWRPRIVLPVDFEQRYTAPERRLVLLHEQVHLRRGDTVVNALLAAMQCLYWFNPLLPLAVRRCREDQELSCDERVVARSAGARRSYGDAMLKTGLALSPLPVGCHWQNHHPLKARIAMLKRPVPGKKQWFAIVLLCAGLSTGLGYAAWAAQPAVDAGSPAIEGPAALRTVAAEYPDGADGINGAVTVTVEIDVDGRVTGATVQSSEPKGVFDAAALDAVRQYRYAPTYRNGHRVAARASEAFYWDAFMKSTAAPEGWADRGEYEWFAIDTSRSRISPQGTCQVSLPGTEAGVVICGKSRPPE